MYPSFTFFGFGKMFLFKRMWDAYLRTESENKRKAGFNASVATKHKSRGAVFFTVLLNKPLVSDFLFGKFWGSL